MSERCVRWRVCESYSWGRVSAWKSQFSNSEMRAKQGLHFRVEIRNYPAGFGDGCLDGRAELRRDRLPLRGHRLAICVHMLHVTVHMRHVNVQLALFRAHHCFLHSPVLFTRKQKPTLRVDRHPQPCPTSSAAPCSETSFRPVSRPITVHMRPTSSNPIG